MKIRAMSSACALRKGEHSVDYSCSGQKQGLGESTRETRSVRTVRHPRLQRKADQEPLSNREDHPDLIGRAVGLSEAEEEELDREETHKGEGEGAVRGSPGKDLAVTAARAGAQVADYPEDCQEGHPSKDRGSGPGQ